MEETTPNDPPPDAGLKRIIIITIVISVVALGGLGAAAYFLKNDKLPMDYPVFDKK